MPSTLGPYEIRSELGHGAMAVVWRAYDPVLDRQVAIKEPLLPRGVDSTEAAEFGARFVREGRAAAKLNHPNIVTIHAADIYEGRAALVMELVEGQTLREVIDTGSLESGLALSILEQLLSAVGYAHERGIVHRDIKPDNVFVTPDGRVKLADFGIASLASDSTLTQAGTIMGTPGYMAPEQVTGDPVDARADIFACGVLAYEMLTGKNPFGTSEGLPATTVMYRIVHQAPPELPPEALASLLPQLSAVLGAALAKNPEDRFPDAASFLAALRGEGGLPVPGVPAGPSVLHSMGTMLGRVKSATMISRGPGKPQEPSWKRSWVPYAAVVGIGLMVMIALLVSAGRGGGGMSVAVPIDTLSSVATDSTVETATDSSYLSPVDQTGAYLDAMESLAGNLARCDERMPQLADVINAGVRSVPPWVVDEFQSMIAALNGDLSALQAVPVPTGYSSANTKLVEATNHMIDRIAATQAGVEAAWAGRSYLSYFGAGKTARDAYRADYAAFWAIVP